MFGSAHPARTAFALFLVSAVLVQLMGMPAAADTGGAVRLVQHPDGRLEVQTGSRFAAQDVTVLAQEQDVVLRTAGVAPDLLDTSTGRVTDALRADQWNLDTVQAEAAWARSTGSGQIIAILDSGVDGTHPDLVDRLVPGTSTTGTDPLVDLHGHGTHVAGTAAASLGGGYGVAGMAPDAAIMPVKVTDDRGIAYASDVAEGLLWAVEHGATIANLSLAGTHKSTVLNRAIDAAIEQGVVVVVAGGNEHARGNPTTYPASHPDVIAVAAMRDASTRSAFSSTGDWIDLAAPGSAILSTRPAGDFGYASGTSMAAPLVAGAVALLRSADPGLDPAGVRDLLAAHARDLGTSGWDEEFGAGALDVASALPVGDAAPPAIPDPGTGRAEGVAEQVAAPDAGAQPLTRIPGLFSPRHYTRSH